MAPKYCPICGRQVFSFGPMCPKCEFDYKDNKEMKDLAMKRHVAHLINTYDEDEDRGKSLREKYPINWDSFGYSGGSCSSK